MFILALRDAFCQVSKPTQNTTTSGPAHNFATVKWMELLLYVP